MGKPSPNSEPNIGPDELGCTIVYWVTILNELVAMGLLENNGLRLTQGYDETMQAYACKGVFPVMTKPTLKRALVTIGLRRKDVTCVSRLCWARYEMGKESFEAMLNQPFNSETADNAEVGILIGVLYDVTFVDPVTLAETIVRGRFVESGTSTALFQPSPEVDQQALIESGVDSYEISFIKRVV